MRSTTASEWVRSGSTKPLLMAAAAGRNPAGVMGLGNIADSARAFSASSSSGMCTLRVTYTRVRVSGFSVVSRTAFENTATKTGPSLTSRVRMLTPFP
eukprot:861368-Pyramimonas_sp.AAC.1